MANILYRGSAIPSTVNSAGGKNAALTNVEIDQNFYALERDKFDKVLGGTITGNATFASSSTVTIDGNLIVNGTTTTINSTTVDVDDINITLGSVASPTNATANGGGITLKGATDKTFNWYSSTSAWTSSEHLSLAAGKNILLNGSTSGTITLAVPASAGINTITFQAASGTVAHLSNIGDGSITVNTGSGLSGSGSFTTNQNGATTITLSHADTSSVTDLSSANNTFITAETYDTFGHVQTRTTGTVDFTVAANYAFQNIAIGGNSGYTWGAANTNTTQAADSSSDTLTLVNGGGINLYTNTIAGTDAILIEHSDTSSVSNLSSDNSGNTFIQDISFTFDTYGHVTAASVATGTVTVGDATLTIAAGNAITLGNTSGANTFSANTSTANTITVNHADTSSVADAANNQNTYVSGISFDTYGHVTGITRNTVVEYDTLATVTGRGSSTTTASTFSGGLLLAGSTLNLRAGGYTISTSTNSKNSPTTNYAAGWSSSGIFIEPYAGDNGGIYVGEDACTIWNAADSGYLFRIIEEDDWQSTGMTQALSTGTDPGTDVSSGPVRLVLDSSGNLNIRGTFRGYGDIKASGYLQVGIGNTSSSIYMADQDETQRMIHCNSNKIGFLTSSAAWGSYCENDGSWVSVGNITAQSDIRIKTNIKKIDNALNKVEQLNGYTFDRTDIEMPRQTGVIAQEVLKVLPEAVAGNEDSYTVAYGNMVGLLIEAIKELNAKVEDLQNQLANK